MKRKFIKDGFCNAHGTKATNSKLNILTKKWAVKRGWGYGWKTLKVTRFLCEAKE